MFARGISNGFGGAGGREWADDRWPDLGGDEDDFRNGGGTNGVWPI